MSKWSSESMSVICEQVKQYSEYLVVYDVFKPYAVRFDSDGDIAIVHRCSSEELYSQQTSSSPYYYVVTWITMYDDTEITPNSIIRWEEDGQTPWEGNSVTYELDKMHMIDEGSVYMNLYE